MHINRFLGSCPVYLRVCVYIQIYLERDEGRVPARESSQTYDSSKWKTQSRTDCIPIIPESVWCICCPWTRHLSPSTPPKLYYTTRPASRYRFLDVRARVARVRVNILMRATFSRYTPSDTTMRFCSFERRCVKVSVRRGIGRIVFLFARVYYAFVNRSFLDSSQSSKTTSTLIMMH